MKKLILSALLWSSTWAHGKTAEEFINQAYPREVHAVLCRVAYVEDNAYCMRPVKEEIRDTAQGKMKYVLWAGNYFDEPNLKEEFIHVASGLAGVFVFRQLAGRNNWELVASEPFQMVGSYGRAPEKEGWSFHEFGKDKWGFLTEHSDVHQGYSGSHYVILAHDGGKKVVSSWLGSSFANTGAYGENCENHAGEDDVLSPKEYKACMAKLTNIESKIKILRNEKMVNGFYPLEITLTGFQGKTKFNHQAYTMKFDTKQAAYVEPKHYPLRGIEY